MAAVHPAVEIVAQAEGLWADSKYRAYNRAHLIVRRLIETGHLAGAVDAPNGLPMTAEEGE